MSYVKFILRSALTVAVFVIAVVAGYFLWRHYMYSPWTRDGRVQADVIDVAPDVSGLIATVPVRENQYVHRGEVLFTIDAERFQIALAQSNALVAAQRADAELKRRDSVRRAALSGIVIAAESQDTSASAASVARATYDQAVAARSAAELNLKRTEVRAPVDGYVTNLDVHPGDYANTGRAALAVIDSHSFRVNGYFEETKISLVHEGDPVRLDCMSTRTALNGHVEGISRGIADRDNPSDSHLLAAVNPTFTWVRLAQRVPVRISIDPSSAAVPLSVGMTCTATVIVRASS